VRVLSDGDNGGADRSAGGAGPQSIRRSILAMQIPWLQLRAPLRVISDGDNAGVAAPGGEPDAGGSQTITDTIGGIQLGAVEIDAPVAVASDTDDAGDTPTPGENPATPIDAGGASPGGDGDRGAANGGGSDGAIRPGSTSPAVDVLSDDTADGPLAAMQGVAARTAELDSGLPFTGLAALVIGLTGLLFLLAGRGLLIAGTQRGPRRPRLA
jgi:hypothetical protein